MLQASVFFGFVIMAVIVLSIGIFKLVKSPILNDHTSFLFNRLFGFFLFITMYGLKNSNKNSRPDIRVFIIQQMML